VQSNSGTRLGSINTRLYALGNQQDTAATGIRDVITGNNDFNGVTGFQAGTGFDLASGWGTPDVATFVPAYLGLPIPTATPTPDLAAISVPRSVSLPPTGIGVAGGSSKTFVIKNTGKSGTLSGNAVPQDASQFKISPGSFSIAPHASSTQTVTFVPTAAGKQSTNLMVTSNATNEPTANVTLEGVGEAGRLIAPRLEALVATVGTPTTKNIVLKNAGKGVLSLGVGAASPNPPYASGASSPTLQPGASATVSITFSPSAKGAAVAGGLPITVNPPSTASVTIMLKGTGK
jgi:hypothetical protein